MFMQKFLRILNLIYNSKVLSEYFDTYMHIHFYKEPCHCEKMQRLEKVFLFL